MPFCSKIKFLFVSTLVFYLTYLYAFKCPKLVAPIDDALEGTAFEPLGQVHIQACDALQKGVLFIHPYVAQIQAAVTSHSLYEIHAAHHVNTIQSHYYKSVHPVVVKVHEHVHPYLVKAYEFVEVYEQIVYAYILEFVGKAKAFYAKEVAPKFA